MTINFFTSMATIKTEALLKSLSHSKKLKEIKFNQTNIEDSDIFFIDNISSIKEVRQIHKYKKIFYIDSEKDKLKIFNSFSTGANNFISFPFIPSEVEIKFLQTVDLEDYEDEYGF